MEKMVYFALLFGLVCFFKTAYSSHIEETGMDEAEMERRRTYCVRVSRVSKRDLVEVRPVNCEPGFEFCFTSTTCCCEQIPEPKNVSLAVGLGLGIGGFVLSALIFITCFICYKRPTGRPPREMDYPSLSQRSATKGPLSDVSSMQNYQSKYGPTPSSYYGAPSEKYGYPRGDDGSLDSFDIGKMPPLSISGSLPPPPYSEHSFAAGRPDGPVVLYKPGRGADMTSQYGYSKRASRAGSVTSWVKSQEGARSQQRRSSTGSNRSVVRNSRPASRASTVANGGFEPETEQQQHYLMTIPSVSAGSTVAASEVIYNSVGAMSQRGSQSGERSQGRASSVGRNTAASTARNA